MITKDDFSQKFSNKFDKDLSEAKEKHLKELDLTKRNITELYEKRLQFLKDSKDESDSRVLRLEAEIKEKDESYNDLLIEHRKLESRVSSEVNELRMQARMKTDEYQRISNLYEDNLILVKETKIENEHIRTKLEIVKQDYYKLESAKRTENADMHA